MDLELKLVPNYKSRSEYKSLKQIKRIHEDIKERYDVMQMFGGLDDSDDDNFDMGVRSGLTLE